MKCSTLFASVILSAPAAAQAVNVVFNLTGASTATLAGATYDTGESISNATDQLPGSMGPRTVMGTMTVAVDDPIAPTSIQFVSASLSPVNFGTPLQPALGGFVGSDFAEFGWQFSDPSPIGGGTEFMAWRDSLTTISSEAFSVNGAGNYSTTGILFAHNIGSIALRGHDTGAINGSLGDANNTSFANGSYTVEAATGVATLTLPNFDITYSVPLSRGPLTLHLVGSLEGTASVPEPASASLLAGAVGMALQRRSGVKRQQRCNGAAVPGIDA